MIWPLWFNISPCIMRMYICITSDKPESTANQHKTGCIAHRSLLTLWVSNQKLISKFEWPKLHVHSTYFTCEEDQVLQPLKLSYRLMSLIFGLQEIIWWMLWLSCAACKALIRSASLHGLVLTTPTYTVLYLYSCALTQQTRLYACFYPLSTTTSYIICLPCASALNCTTSVCSFYQTTFCMVIRPSSIKYCAWLVRTIFNFYQLDLLKHLNSWGCLIAHGNVPSLFIYTWWSISPPVHGRNTYCAVGDFGQHLGLFF